MDKYSHCSVDITKHRRTRLENTDGSIAWNLDPYTEDILDLLMNDENESEDGNDNEEESEQESEVESETSDGEEEYVTY